MSAQAVTRMFPADDPLGEAGRAPRVSAAGVRESGGERAWLHDADRAWASDDFWLFDDETAALLRQSCFASVLVNLACVFHAGKPTRA